jgi:3-deoxy-manno-octulosonate cytidylyltransferase (CMP-KDO synthetase)
MSPEYHIVIPARLGSTRLPGKPLLEIDGRPIIQHVWDRAQESGASSVTVATDAEEIVSACAAFGADAVLTDPSHESGTDRVAEVARARGWPDEAIIVNLQGDEPEMPAELLDQVALLLAGTRDSDFATLAVPIASDDDLNDPHQVKVVRDRDGHALYFSRAGIPWPRERGLLTPMRHLGLYAYRHAALEQFVAHGPCELELTESLEQLRALWLGLRIVVARARVAPPPGIDTRGDLERARGTLTRG